MKCMRGLLPGSTGCSWRIAALVVACIGAFVLLMNDASARMRDAAKPLVKVGEDAPDFELPRLTITTDPNGKPMGVISDADTIRLSAFRGKKPVCLIMSSYT